MKRSILFVLIILPAAFAGQAQRLKNQFQLSGEAAIPGKDYELGWGLHVKWLHNLGSSGQLTVSAGYVRVSADQKTDNRGSLHLVPFLVGYRHQFGKLFIEPQAGYGELRGRFDIGGDYARPSVGAFMWGGAAGLLLKRFDVGVRYLSAHGAEGSQSGAWHNEQFNYTGIFAAYNLRKASR